LCQSTPSNLPLPIHSSAMHCVRYCQCHQHKDSIVCYKIFKYDHPHNINCWQIKTKWGRMYLKSEEMNAEHKLTSDFVMHAAFQKSSQGDDGKGLQIISLKQRWSNVEATVHEPATSWGLLTVELQWVDTKLPFTNRNDVQCFCYYWWKFICFSASDMQHKISKWVHEVHC